jgi:C1A family cysteine protease
MDGYFTMPYAYLTNPSLAADFWAVYAVEKPASTGA